MATILIGGGTGLVGTALTDLLLQKGYDVIILTRNTRKEMIRRHAVVNPRTGNWKPVTGNYPSTSSGSATGNLSYALWNTEQQTIDENAIRQSDYIINVAGASIAEKRWTAKRKKELIDSRVNSGKLIVKALKVIPNKVKAVINASAIGWYGADDANDKGNSGFIETHPADEGFLGTTCRLWEQSIEPVSAFGKRLIKFRFGIVLSKNGGALAEFKKPIRFGIAPILGTGKQIISWIHLDDLCRLLVFAIENENLSGTYNAVSPLPVSNKNLVLKLSKKIKGRLFLPFYVPAFVLKLILGEMSIEVLKSATVNGDKIKKAGFTFQYPEIDSALDHLTN